MQLNIHKKLIYIYLLYIYIYIYIYIYRERERERGPDDVMAIVVGNAYGDPSSILGLCCFHIELISFGKGMHAIILFPFIGKH